MSPGQLSTLMGRAGQLSIVAGALHTVGSARVLILRDHGYLHRGPYLMLITLLLVCSGAMLLWASRGVRSGSEWSNAAVAFAAVQGIGLALFVAPGFIARMSPLFVAPVALVGAHGFFLWKAWSTDADSAP